MKKLICVVTAAVMLVAMLASCSVGVFECDLCGETKAGVKHEKSMLGYSIVFCDDCRKDLEQLGEWAGLA